MTSSAYAMVQHGVRDLRRQDVPLPRIADDDALLRIEACGICGSDYEQYEGALRAQLPAIPGHEPVGVIEEIGGTAAARWGVAKGDRVAVEPMFPCGHCRDCITGGYRFCRGGDAAPIMGFRPLALEPGLWGGYATHMYLPPHAVMHPISSELAPEIATLFNPIGAGFRWAVEMPKLAAGETMVVLGPGQRGIASVIAAREAGAGCIIVTGLTRDAAKLELALAFGANHAVDVEREDLRRRVREVTDGAMADVVVDVTSYSVEAITQAISLARRGGRIVLAGTKGPRPVPDFISDVIVGKELVIMGALGVDWRSYDTAIKVVESGRYPLEKMHTHTLPLTDAARALDLLAGRIEGETAVHIALVP